MGERERVPEGAGGMIWSVAGQDQSQLVTGICVARLVRDDKISVY